MSFLPVEGACAVTVEVWVVAVVAADVDVAFARDEARVLVTVCCNSITTCGSALVEVALVFRAFFLGTSGGGVPCCELCSEADSAASVEAAAAAVRRVERRVAVADMSKAEVSRRVAQARGVTYWAVAIQLLISEDVKMGDATAVGGAGWGALSVLGVSDASEEVTMDLRKLSLPLRRLRLARKHPRRSSRQARHGPRLGMTP